jgi:pSer/pThr/pTyr-binding forkhead associated (FHA) protein
MDDVVLIVEIKNGPEDGKVYKLTRKDFPVTIGRDSTRNTVSIPIVYDSFVSKRHAEITFRDGAYMIKDLGSTNGTLVNSMELGRGEEAEIEDRTWISPGKATKLQVRLPQRNLTQSVLALVRSRAPA